MATMRAVLFDKTGGPEVLHVAEVPKPVPTPDQALVKMEWAGVNFIDTYHRTGLYPIKLPFITGRDGAGVVEALGSDVSPDSGIKVGDRVAIYDSSTVAQYLATKASRLLKLPEGVDTRAGAALMAQGLTAWTLVRDAHEVKPGEVILVHAAAGGTGGLLVQMCKSLGATVIGTASSPEKIEIAKQHGCDHVINYSEKNTLEEVMKLTDGKGCHAVFSGIGQATFKDDLECVRRKGSMVTFGNASGAVEGFRPLELGKKNVKLLRPRLDAYIVDQEEFDQRSKELSELIASGAVKLTYGNEYSMEEVGQAHIDLTSRKTTGKLLIKIA
ncbi:putative quinone oxidoreductase protein [Phaeoacremonium minimum UCRPA7]|uniref:Probable quinone oxidoreductase n=1 Tax=Phaeoacremonium minimum (strain UCR-PA7) TaxID=1286976 RepID=R8BJI5_PHAM7|nr:putative quinone oxidoreductase protein [Phaeoacremonium minimum UCRPA7]EON99382.1 putative quinone oxidoreductase protein [Phaeoacremonium minimum UCRPA7]